MTTTENTPEPPAPPQRRTDLILAVVLMAVAAYLVASRYTTATVDWYLGDIRRDLGDVDARNALRQLGDRALPRLEEELRSPDPDSRLVAVFAASVIDGAGAERLLARAAKDEDALTASNAVAACGARRDGATFAAILGALDDKRHQVRIAARRTAAKRCGNPWWAFGLSSGG